MGFRKAGAWLGLAGEGDDALLSDRYAYEETAAEPLDDETPSGQVARGNNFQIAMVRPRNFRDANTVGEYFRQDVPVIINLEDMEDGDARRIIDFASGLILGRRGEIERLSRRIFLLLPADTTIHIPQEKLSEEGFFNQA
ncbi:cell division inhibitor SepF [Lipingzhangella halophila]|uniref:Cell division protein SepF n=1 Tax=Lipingzhangella halophila TaxID=1783352 RepID=A0A7W7RMP7_9ACTN|nr:cell division protein SepF [Lipingzhangella halophila]MBB4934791.1 cell division inhibitor SepF [Lipingzhangella halophila]